MHWTIIFYFPSKKARFAISISWHRIPVATHRYVMSTFPTFHNVLLLLISKFVHLFFKHLVAAYKKLTMFIIHLCYNCVTLINISVYVIICQLYMVASWFMYMLFFRGLGRRMNCWKLRWNWIWQRDKGTLKVKGSECTSFLRATTCCYWHFYLILNPNENKFDYYTHMLLLLTIL